MCAIFLCWPKIRMGTLCPYCNRELGPTIGVGGRMRSCPYCGREWRNTPQDDESSYITVFSTHTPKKSCWQKTRDF